MLVSVDFLATLCQTNSAYFDNFLYIITFLISNLSNIAGSSTIKIQDDSGSVYEVGSHDLSSDAQALYLGRVLMLLLTVFIHTLIY